MKLTIISPTKKESHEIQWVEINTPTGNYVIQPGHAPMILTLSSEQPVIFCLLSGALQKLIIKRGTIKITRTDLLLILSEYP